MIKRIFCVVFVVAFAVAANAQTSRKSVSGAEVTGTFKMSFIGKKYKGMSNDLEIQALGKGRLKIWFDLIYPYTMRNGEVSVNMGDLFDEIPIEGDTAVYKSEDGRCTITIKFTRPGEVKVTQDETEVGCGFGHNVSAAGTYKKTSSAKPKFNRPEM